MTRSALILLGVMCGVGGPASAAPTHAPSRWAHVGDTYNSVIFVDRAVLAERGRQRPFRTLHINMQPRSGWTRAEHEAVVDCGANTVRHGDAVMTMTGGRVERQPGGLSRAVPFPARGVVLDVLKSICSGRLGPPIADPEAWARDHFRPG